MEVSCVSVLFVSRDYARETHSLMCFSVLLLTIMVGMAVTGNS